VKVGSFPKLSSGPSLINGGWLYFTGQGTVGPEPWITDGTAAGSRLLKDINPGASSAITWFEGFHSDTLFAVTDPSFGEQLWRVDGSTAATTLISTVPVDPSTATGAYQYTQYTPARHRLTVGNTFFFAGTDPTSGTELYAWATDPPVATADTGNSANDQSVTLNVLANDAATDGTLDPSTVQITTKPGHGTVTVNADGTVAYTPTAGFGGTDTFAYTVSDKFGGTSAPATVTVSVTASTVTVTGSTGGGGDSNSKGGGGGSLDLLSILVLTLGLCAVARNRSQLSGVAARTRRTGST
jgi:ELWxxDGT repeat protein